MLIYKITNKLNNKCYIGQTIVSADERWKQHQQHYKGSHPNDQNKVLYQAMRKYGIENFTFEVIQDNIETFEQLDKAEIYWVDFYDSYYNGYNASKGGQAYHKYFPDSDIIKDYHKTKSARKTALNFGIDHSTVDRILDANNIPRYSFREASGQQIKISKDNFEKTFNSVQDCAEWFIEQKIPRTKNVESARTGLKNARSKNGNGYYYGYKIENI